MRALALLASLLAAPAAAQIRYDVQPTAVEGSARNVGLGGANIAAPWDYSAAFVNPAGLGGLADDGVDFGSDSNNVDNFVEDLSNPSSRALNAPLKYSFYGARYVTPDGWGVGVAAQTPFNLDDLFTGDAIKGKNGALRLTANQDQTEIKVQDRVYTLAGAKTYLDKRLSLGLALNYIQVYESYDFTPVSNPRFPAVHNYAVSDAFSADAGAIGRPVSWLQLALAYKMGYRVPFDDTRNAGLQLGVSPFHDAKAPDRVSLGAMWTPVKMFRLYAQGTYTIGMKSTVVVGSGLFPTSVTEVATGRYDMVDGHWGMEFIPIDEPDLTMKFWAGGYLEVTGIEGGYTRYHRTAGMSFQPWFLGASAAIDDAELYDNFVVGVGVDMLELASRIAKKYHWKLPIE